MQKVTRNVDALGFDKFQIASIRRAFDSNKVTYKKMEKLAEKINALGEEYNKQKEELEAWEAPVKVLSEKVLGMVLTSQEILAYHKEPKLFAERFPEHPVSETILSSLGETPTEAVEETSEEPVQESEPGALSEETAF